MPSLYGGWPVRGGCVNSKQSSVELCMRLIIKRTVSKYCKDSKTDFKDEIQLALHDLQDTHINVNFNILLPEENLASMKEYFCLQSSLSDSMMPKTDFSFLQFG